MIHFFCRARQPARVLLPVPTCGEYAQAVQAAGLLRFFQAGREFSG
ncbi:hypothetical protein [Gelria sp. Kuro-4]|nr:hypothetical protein [Gelria sp. Kuro-4]BCV23889.1 hypothetical protein kuro4_06620 [Gelria sp. Kuro-4]